MTRPDPLPPPVPHRPPPWHRPPPPVRTPWHEPGYQPPPVLGTPYGHPPPPRHVFGLGAVVAVLAVVALVVVFGVAALATTQGDSRTAEPGYERYQPRTPGPTATTTTTTTAPASATAVPRRGNRTRVTTPAAPPAPVHRLADNPIFRADLGLAPVDCRLPRFSADPTVQVAFYRAAVDCLDEAWLPVLRAAGLPASSPRVEVPTGPFNTPCGNKPAIAPANYCEGTIHMPPRYFDELERLPVDRPELHLGVLAHEYGHHVQELAGVMDAAWERRYDQGVDSDAGLDVSRRNELLATCFGGMFYASAAGRGSITTEMLEAVAHDQARRGDQPDSGQPRDHGTPSNNGSWFEQGLRLNRTAQCNTWLAPERRIS